MKPCVFLDRDGTIIDEVSYLSSFDQIRFYEDVPASLVQLKAAGYLLLLITNQSGVARGYFEAQFVEDTFVRLNEILADYKVQLDGQFYCPHHPIDGNSIYTKRCNCRKPEPGMIEQACKQFPVDLTRSFLLGDKLCDMQLAKNTGVKGCLLKTGHGKEEVEKVTTLLPDTPVFNDFSSATNHIIHFKGPF